MAFKIGFGTPRKKPGLQKNPLASKEPLLGDDESEDEPSQGNAEVPGRSKTSKVGSSKPLKSSDKPKTRVGPLPSLDEDLAAQIAKKKTIDSALEVDPTIYDYDAAFDVIHAKDAERKAERRREAEERKSKYMDNFIVAAETRKQDLARAKDKQLQREREAEGDMFADKEKFVTEAYKKQQEEVRLAEIEEKKRQELEEKRRGELGMQGFYKGVMEEKEKRYQEAMAAAAEAQKSGLPVASADEEEEKTDLEIAKELQQKGKSVLLNDEGEIVDKRETLSAGLNILKKPKAATASKAPSIAIQSVWKNKNAGNQQAMRERQTKMMEEQLVQAAKRAADDEAEETRKLEHAAKSRKTEGDIMSAKERYLARKKAAEEAKKKGNT